jgi:hypothetical protein
MPDLDAGPFVASFSRNLIGRNDLDVVANSKGLLTSATSTTTSELAAILTTLAGYAGTQSTHPLNTDEEAAKDCPADASAVLTVMPTFAAGATKFSRDEKPQAFEKCPITITVQREGTKLGDNPKFKSIREKQTGPFARSFPGFFYRQNFPFAVTVHVGNFTSKGLAFLPNASPTQYVPVGRTLFADSTSTLKFEDGTLTQYHQAMPGEAIALVGLPAKILTAYFEAIGTMFGKRSEGVKKESEYQAAVIAAMKAQVANEKCIAALKARDDAAIHLACGG